MNDGEFTYVFEISQPGLKEIMNENTTLTIQGKEVIIKNKTKEGYLMPVGFLEKRWTYTTGTLASLFELEGEKVIRISDEGKMMLTIKSEYGLYSYILLPTDKADIPVESPDPDSPAYQYEQAQLNN